MRRIILGIVIGILASVLAFAAVARDESPDVLVTFGCFAEQTALDLAYVWVEKGDYYFDETANSYLQSNECFILYDPGYPAYIDRMVKQLSKEFLGLTSYVVEAHFFGTPPIGDKDYKPFYFLYHGELPERAVIREAL